MVAPDPIHLMVVEDDDDFRSTASRWMERQGHRVEGAANAQEALHVVGRKRIDVAVVDLNMPGLSGIELLHRFKEAEIDTQVIILTGQASVETAVEAMKLGAADYLTKPFPLSELEARCRLAYERGRLRKENRQLKAIIDRSRPVTKLVGESPLMREVYRLIERVGPTEKAVLIQGESGTGKELVARAIQAQSRRAERPFVTINCAALPEQLIESELFGHEKGAFTGAVSNKPGLFEVADGGTLFIDEIGELATTLQPKLLRALEDGSFRRVGSHQERLVDVRVIAATNRNLEHEVAEGRFREDLYYRINVMSLVLPPLREREGDISLLINHFLDSKWTVEPEAQALLENYRWPGNVRQLINTLERATVLADDGVITMQDLPRELVCSTKSAPARPAAQRTSSQSLEDLERAHIIDVLKQQKGNKARAARVLGIHRRKLYRLIDRYHIDPDAPHESTSDVESAGTSPDLQGSRAAES